MTRTSKEKSSLLDGLNKVQAEAVQHRMGSLLIVAGAGTGKTTVITRKIAWLIERKLANPENILAVTFTEKAATEMEERVDQLLPYGYVDVAISTFHAFCERVLRDHGLDVGLPADFKLLSTAEQWLLVRQNLDKFELDYYRPLGNPTKFIHALIRHFSRLKDEDISTDEYLKYAEGRMLNLDSAEFIGSKEEEEQEVKRLLEVASAYHLYQKLLLDKGALDFGDLITETLRLLSRRPNILKTFREKYKYILVDEFQDTNYAQYELVKLLAGDSKNLTVVADDDQSIYKFRGASFSNIIKFKQDFPESHQVSLIENYRNSQNILDLSYKFIQGNNPDRLEVQLAESKSKVKGQKSKVLGLSKKLVSKTGAEGTINHFVFNDQYDEVEGVISQIQNLKSKNLNLTWNDFAILARSHDALVPFIEKLDEKQIPYIYFANRGLYRKSIVLDILSYFRLLDNYHESEALYRVLNFPIFKISHSGIVEVSHYARKKSLSLYEALARATSIDNLSLPDREGVQKIFMMLQKHTKLSREKSIQQVFIQVFNDLEFTESIVGESYEQAQNVRFLEAFNNKIKNFLSLSPDKSLKSFMSQVASELEAGEEGTFEQDIEAGPEAIKIMTVHAAKGLEFENVFIVGLVDKRFPTIERSDAIEVPKEIIKDILPQGDIHLQEERRLLYVAMTRAKTGLYLTRALDYGGKLTKKPSRFLVELGLTTEEKSKPTGEIHFNKADVSIRLPLPKSFSFSQISTFRKCPLEYKYKYILGLPTPGNWNLSFGQTMHRVFEKYLWLYQQQGDAPDLFGKKNDKKLPDFEILKKLYGDNWIDDWYDSKEQMEKYREVGKKMLKTFYDECVATLPEIIFLESPFEMRLGSYRFAGKIDRAESSAKGLVIIDYKTGLSRKIDKVDKEQLLIYQWAAQEFFKRPVADLQYWFFGNGESVEKIPFVGTDADIAALKKQLAETIDEIVECLQKNNFAPADFKISHDCKYRNLEKGLKPYLPPDAAAKGTEILYH